MFKKNSWVFLIALLVLISMPKGKAEALSNPVYYFDDFSNRKIETYGISTLSNTRIYDLGGTHTGAIDSGRLKLTGMNVNTRYDLKSSNYSITGATNPYSNPYSYAVAYDVEIDPTSPGSNMDFAVKLDSAGTRIHIVYASNEFRLSLRVNYNAPYATYGTPLQKGVKYRITAVIDRTSQSEARYRVYIDNASSAALDYTRTNLTAAHIPEFSFGGCVHGNANTNIVYIDNFGIYGSAVVNTFKILGIRYDLFSSNNNSYNVYVPEFSDIKESDIEVLPNIGYTVQAVEYNNQNKASKFHFNFNGNQYYELNFIYSASGQPNSLAEIKVNGASMNNVSADIKEYSYYYSGDIAPTIQAYAVDSNYDTTIIQTEDNTQIKCGYGIYNVSLIKVKTSKIDGADKIAFTGRDKNVSYKFSIIDTNDNSYDSLPTNWTIDHESQNKGFTIQQDGMLYVPATATSNDEVKIQASLINNPGIIAVKSVSFAVIDGLDIIGPDKVTIPTLNKQAKIIKYSIIVKSSNEILANEPTQWNIVSNTSSAIFDESSGELKFSQNENENEKPGSLIIKATLIDDTNIIAEKVVSVEEPVISNITIEGTDNIIIPAIGEQAVNLNYLVKIEDQTQDDYIPLTNGNWTYSAATDGVTVTVGSNVYEGSVTITDKAKPISFSVQVEYPGSSLKGSKLINLVRAPSIPNTISISGPTEIIIPQPASSNTKVSYEAIVRDQYGEVMSSHVMWTLEPVLYKSTISDKGEMEVMYGENVNSAKIKAFVKDFETVVSTYDVVFNKATSITNEKLEEKETKVKISGGNSLRGFPANTDLIAPTPIDNTGKVNYFKDLEDFGWANESIAYLYEKDILKGTGEGVFDPRGNITRAQFMALIFRSVNLNGESNDFTFKDVNKDDWYYDSVLSAYSNGILLGYEDRTFRPNNSITRQDMAVILYRIFKEKGIKIVNSNQINRFIDSNLISNYAMDAINTVYDMGIIKGFDDGRYSPDTNLTRAEAAVIIYRLLMILN